MNKELIEKIITYNYNEFGAEYGDALVYLKQENEWLHHIIEEARKYTKSHFKEMVADEEAQKLLEILDKVSDE